MEDRLKPKYETLFAQIHDACGRDLLDKETDEEADLLQEYPLLWLRALRSYEEVVFARIADANASIDHMKPASGEVQTKEFLKAKSIVNHTKRELQKQITEIRVRREEAKAMLGTSDCGGPFTTGGMLERLDLTRSLMAAGNHEDALASLETTIKMIDDFEIAKENAEDE